MPRFLCACVALCLAHCGVHAQLRPRRVGVNPMGEAEVGAEAGGAEPDMASLLKNMMGGTNGGGMDMESLASSLQENPMLQQMMASNPEMQELMTNPAALQEKMAELQQLMSSDEGREASAKIMEEVQSVLTDPEKMRQGLEQFASNPMLKSVADAVPELKEVLNNPALMEESIAQAQKMFSGGMGLDGEKLQEMMQMMQQPNALKDMLANPELLQESMKQAQAMFGGGAGGGGGLEGLMNGGDLKERVRAQMARMQMEQQSEGEEF
eukprot:CAMPEP_0119060344 /NCGR_PEP_ID=MMETSP1178-20130426/4322_1 /TAXON_ID=33656 /ORGANISM="unid sp, Strain CCMP2000" /LENGTH=266 /DNA_ID=CAMNT_0007041441 /DNA_START=17 /DNA_END=817 /DNA_ORIENTATION=+